MARHPGELPSPVTRAALPLAVLASLVLVAGCHRSRPTLDTAPTGRVTTITQEEIARMGASTAWDVVRARAPRIYSTGAGGRPTDLRLQEPRSVNADEAPLLVVDGVPMFDLDWLTQLRASEIAVMRIMDSTAAEPLYGLRAAGGAIVIVTRGGRP